MGNFDCPFCTCVFSSKEDLDSHLEAFTKGKEKHWKLFNRREKVAEISTIQAHGGVDRVIGELSEAILRYRERKLDEILQKEVDAYRSRNIDGKRP